MTPLLKAGLTLVLCLAVTGCSLAPDYKRPEQDIPKEWRSVDLGPSPLNTDWWTRFNDPVLNALVEEALKNNQDLAESLAKIDSAAAKLGVGTSQLAPSVSGAGAATSQSNSTKIANYNSIADRSYVNYQGQLSASWELDFWGKYRNNYTMLSDVLLNTVVSHEALRLSVASQTAQSYFALLALDMQLATAKRTLRTREDAFGIYPSRYRQGDITELDWQRARAEVETARAQVHSSTVAVDSAEASLAVLLGRSPRDIMSAVMPRGGDISKLPAPPVLPAGLPSELLERRPDVRAAEYSLREAFYVTNAAYSAFYPQLTITGSAGWTNSNGMIVNPGKVLTTLIGQLTQPLFAQGRLTANLKVAKSQERVAQLNFEQALLNAGQEVSNALYSYKSSMEKANLDKKQVESLTITRDRTNELFKYDASTTYLEKLTAEMSLLNAQLTLVNDEYSKLQAVVDLYAALGGGRN